MNKTVNINIGGLFFHIDEDAYQKLSRYFDAIKRSLSNSSGKDEIMKDIEMRVAELFTDRQKSDKHVINLKDVDEVVTVMGQPEDYRIDDDGSESTTTQNFNSSNRKKLYRDKDNGLIGGVCTGLGHYFGVDAVWIKIVFILLTWAGGTGAIAYLILWIVTPEAITTSEKLEMTGEPVTISSIEKKVREEFETVSNKLKNVDYDKMGNQIKSTTASAGNKLGDVFTSVFGVFAKVLGAIITVFSSFSLLGICIISIVAMFSTMMPQNTIINHFRTPIGFETPLWIQGILFLLALGIPIFFLLILGLKLLISNMKSLGNVVKYSLLAIWIIALGIFASIIINEATQIAYDGKDVKKETINLATTDTLKVRFQNNDYYDKDVNHRTDFRLTQDDKNQEIIYSNNVYLKVMRTSETVPYLQIEKMAVGKSPSEAKKRAEKIQYNYKIEGNQLILDNYLLSDVTSKLRNQKVELYLYLPKGTLLKTDTSVQDYDNSDNDYFNMHYSSDKYIYKVEDSKIKCLNCPENENDHDDVDINEDDDTIIDSTSTLQINENGIIIKKPNSQNNKEVKEIKINKDGVSIKTK